MDVDETGSLPDEDNAADAAETLEDIPADDDAGDDEDDDAMEVDGGGSSSASGLTRKQQLENEKAARRVQREKDGVKRAQRDQTRKAALTSLDKEREKDRHKRIKFLVNQTDIFKHFLETSTATGNAKKTLRELLASALPETETGAGASDSAAASDETGSPNRRRHRKTEKEEDAEILAETESNQDMIRFTETPKYINGEMRDYQVMGLNWLISLYENGINGILADEMGLGKSLQTISLLGYLKHFANVSKGPHLLVTPKTTLHNWMNEFKKWCPSLKAFVLHGSKEDRAALVDQTLFGRDWDVCITSYEMVLLEKAALKKIAWHYIVIDEAHRIKNENSMLSQIMRILDCKNRLLITGTPLQNSLHELWALLNFLLPDVFGSSEDFDAWFTFNDENDKEAAVKQLHKVLKPFLLRRLKLDVEKSLKPKKETKLYLGMSTLQRDIYQKLLMKDIDAINGALGKGEGKTRLLNIVMQLRKCCNHPYLFDGVEPGPPYTTDEHLVKASGKMMVLDKLLPKLKANNSRVLLFSQMSRVLDILEDYCVFRNHAYCRIDGQTDHESRQAQIEDFNREGSDKFIFLLTTRAGGLGINLATADIVVLYDSDWNPQVDLQAQDRAHRIGQKKQVHVFRFVTEQSVEEKMIERAEMKLRLDQVVIQQGSLQQSQKAATKDELLNMIQYGAQEVLLRKGDEGFTADNIEELISKGEAKTEQLQSKLKAAGLDVLQSFSLDGSTQSVYQWEGEDYRDKQVTGAINWIEPAKRDRTRNYNIDEYYRDALSQQRMAKAPREPRPPRQAHLSDFQFFPRRLAELQEREIYAYRKLIGYKVPRGQDTESEQRQQEEQEKIDNAEPLTDAEVAEKEKLTEQGFVDWNRRDFYAFVKACERHGRNNLKAIAAEIEGKTFEDVQKYSKVFWERYTELADHEKVVAAISRGESKIKRREQIQRMLEYKVKHKPIVYNQNRGKNYTDEEDWFMVTALERIGYGEDDVYDRIRREIRESPQFRFDWFLKSRTALELQRRCATLITLIEKELGDQGDEDEDEEEARKKSKTAGKKKAEEEVKATPPSGSKKKKRAGEEGDDDSAVQSPAPVVKKTKSTGAAGSDNDAPSPASGSASKKSRSRK